MRMNVMQVHTERVVFETCKCGKQGLRHERDANRYLVAKRRRTEAVEKVSCAVGEMWHIYSPCQGGKASYLEYLTATAGQPAPARAVSAAATASSAGGSIRSLGCTKTGYGSERLAQFALVSAREEGRDEKRAYQCPTCGRWHLSSVREFYTSDQIAVEDLLTVVQCNGDELTTSVGRYPNGQVAHVVLHSSRGSSLRINAEHFTPLYLVLAPLCEAPVTRDAVDEVGT
jgi:predicted RNA-binding Zn-ribbon protein involved in translation (DUF1610 family)